MEEEVVIRILVDGPRRVYHVKNMGKFAYGVKIVPGERKEGDLVVSEWWDLVIPVGEEAMMGPFPLYLGETFVGRFCDSNAVSISVH